MNKFKWGYHPRLKKYKRPAIHEKINSRYKEVIQDVEIWKKDYLENKLEYKDACWFNNPEEFRDTWLCRLHKMIKQQNKGE